MPPVLFDARTHGFRLSGSFAQGPEWGPIALPPAATWRTDLPKVRPDVRRGSPDRVQQAPANPLRNRPTLPALRGVFAGSTQPLAARPAERPSSLAEPPACACVLSGNAVARPGAAELLFGFPVRSAGRAADFFYGSVTPETSRKLLAMCILDTKMAGRVFVSPHPRKRPYQTLIQHG